MFRINCWFAALLAGLCLISSASAEEKPDDSEVVAWVAKAVADRQPTAQERRLDEIGWVKDIRSAIELGKKHNRPIFLFTMKGRINLGRC
jgi:hypothetical protein